MRRLAAGLALATALAGAAGVGYASNGAVKLDAYYGVKIVQNGKEVPFKEHAPFIVDGTTYIPVRALESLYGEKIRWNESLTEVDLGSAPAEQQELPPPSSIGGDASRVNLKKNASMSINGIDMGKSGFYVDQYAWNQSAAVDFVKPVLTKNDP